MSLDERWQRDLDALRSVGRFRSLRGPAGLDFSSNDYLGLGKQYDGTSAPAQGGRVNEGARSGMASRLLRGHHSIWDEVESALASWHRAGAALVFTSGYVANEGLLATLLRPGDVAFSDQANHASIIDGLRLTKARRVPFGHNDLAELQHHLIEAERRREPGQEFFIVTESLFGMEGDRAPLEELTGLAERFRAQMIVDEAHATGCFGPEGAGLVDALGLREKVLATVHTGGKALGVPGAYVCGSPVLKEYLVNQCRHLIFTTALPPAVGQWWLDALGQVRQAEDRRARLHANARFFRGALRDRGVVCPGQDYLVPVLLGSEDRSVAAASHLQAEGFDIRAIRPPTVPVGASRLRISIHADQEDQDLRRLAELVMALLPRGGGFPNLP